ncbi:MAG TPA: putative baseplate assembly protein [Caldimonas sp.]|nr:putative baseplate assembly protein [Caldimonas sp.]
MSADDTGDDCGCCAGTAVDTPAAKANQPGLPAVAYRVGTYAGFRATLLSRLSSTDFPALAALTTRDEDDWTIALTDAFACVADVLTFYQERIANEAWLRTATARRSVLELARLIGYRLAPGVAASTAFAFTLETSPGQRAFAARPVTIPVATRVQSVPDADQSPQNFETTTAITARVEWNAMAAQTGETIVIAPGLTELYIAGTGNSIQQGDAILIVGRERMQDVNSDRWDVRWIDAVEPDTARGVTRLTWSNGLGSPWSSPTNQGIHVYVFRQRATLFGSSAADPKLLHGITNYDPSPDLTGDDWTNKSIHAATLRIDLDAPYPKVVRHGWVALAGGSGGTPPTGYIELYGITGVTQTAVVRYAMSGKVARLTVDSAENLDPTIFGLRTTFALAQSDEVKRTKRPLLYPLYGSIFSLGKHEPQLQPGQLIAVSGKLQRVAIPPDATGISFSDGSTPRPDDTYAMLAAPYVQVSASEWQPLAPADLDPGLAPSGTWRWSVADDDGTELTITAPAGSLLLQAALTDDDVVSECGNLVDGADAVQLDIDSTRLTLTTPLANCYDRTTVTVNANVAPATHGETVGEIGGSGDAAQASQRFALKQAPLTYVSSGSDPSGAASTLQARVGDVLWSERPTLYGSGPRDRVYALRQDDSGTTTVEFGDGVEGARLPSAQNNLRFAYRKGLGNHGNLRTGQLSTLLSRPLGVKSVTNPTPASGGQDAETLARARGNAPLRILTLDRAVSAQDYADFARAFAGIDKASATWFSDGRARGIYVTVAGSGGDAIVSGSATQKNLIAALREFGDPLLPLSVQSYGAATFALAATVKVDRAYDATKVRAAVQAALTTAYAFDARDFGQQVTIDEVYAVIQGVAGVVAADIQELYRVDIGPILPQPEPRLIAALPAVQSDGSVSAAELLTLDATPLSLGVMS